MAENPIDVASDLPEFQAAVKEFIARNDPGDLAGLDEKAVERQPSFAAWRNALKEAGLLFPLWPREFGGGGLGTQALRVWRQAAASAGLPRGRHYDSFNSLVGQLFIEHGSAEQQATYLPRIADAEDIWCQGFSEPSTGSDLASVTTRAELDGGEWVVNGEKVWISQANSSNKVMVLCRTSQEEKRHKGLSLLLLDVSQPGIEVRPLRMLNELEEFSQIFFTDARTAEAEVLGGVGNGWAVAMSLMQISRAGDITAHYPAQFRSELQQLIERVRELPPEVASTYQQRLADLYIKVELIRLLDERARLPQPDIDPQLAASLVKLCWSQHHKRVTELALEVLDSDAMVIQGRDWPVPWGPELGPATSIDGPGSGLGPDSASWIADFLVARAGTIYGGSEQIQRNIIAEYGLGLPK